jgi:hypothetical protein
MFGYADEQSAYLSYVSSSWANEKIVQMRRSLTKTSSDKAYGWTIGSLAGLTVFLALNSAAHTMINNLSLSAPVCIAAGLIMGIVSYKWASAGKARWRNEEGPAPQI